MNGLLMEYLPILIFIGIAAVVALALLVAPMLIALVGGTLRWPVFTAIIGKTVKTSAMFMMLLISGFFAAFLLTRCYRWHVVAIYVACSWAMLYGIFDLVANVAWYPSLVLGI